MVARLASILSISLSFVSALAAHSGRSYSSYEHARTTTLQRRDTDHIPISCSTGPDAKCICPTDLNGDSGVEINVYPGYQCAYPGGACTWNDKTGELQNKKQTNCPANAPCGKFGCSCPPDNNGDGGWLINEFTGYQCAYKGGACTWDFDGNLQNIHQTNCPVSAPCVPRT